MKRHKPELEQALVVARSDFIARRIFSMNRQRAFFRVKCESYVLFSAYQQ